MTIKQQTKDKIKNIIFREFFNLLPILLDIATFSIGKWMLAYYLNMGPYLAGIISFGIIIYLKIGTIQDKAQQFEAKMLVYMKNDLADKVVENIRDKKIKTIITKIRNKKP